MLEDLVFNNGGAENRVLWWLLEGRDPSAISVNISMSTILSAAIDLPVAMTCAITETTTVSATVVPSHIAVFTFSGASFTPSEFIGCWAVVPGSDGTVTAYGQITANDATTISVAYMFGLETIPTSNSNVMITRWPVLDFAPDLTQPVPIQAFNVNANTGLSVFGYTDNFNQKKVVTKAVAKGTDVDGVSISVGISAIHAYNVATQFFENSTYITHPSEGYVYQNTYSSRVVPVTALPAQAAFTFTTNYATFPLNLYISYPETKLQINECIQFANSGGALPAPLSAGVDYYINYISPGASGYIQLSTLGMGYGQPNVTLTSNGTGTQYVIFNGQFVVSAEANFLSMGTPVILCGTTAPGNGNFVFGTTYYCGTDMKGGSTVYLSSTSDGKTRMGIYSGMPGAGLYLVRVSDLVNAPTSGLILPTIWLNGWNLAIPSGTAMSLVTTGGSPISITTSGLPVNVTMNDGTQCSQITCLGNILTDADNFGGKGYCLSPYIFVQSTSAVYTSGSVSLKVGEETLTVTAAGTHATWGPYLTCTVSIRLPSSTLIAYPHGIGAMVAQTDYTESSPQTDSPIDKYGLLIQTLTAGSTITYGNLDTYATLTLLGKSTFYPKASCWTVFNLGYVPQVGEYYGGVQQVSLSMPPRVGDRITIQKNTGDSPVEWQVVAVEWNFDQGQITLTLGDFEKNVFNLLQNETKGFNWTIT